MKMKLVMVAVLVLFLLIPLGLINGTIEDRVHYRAEAVEAVAQSFAGAQQVTGPVLVVPYTDTWQVEEKDALGKLVWTSRRASRYWTFFPKSLSLDGVVEPSVRRRGLHEVRVYELRSEMRAAFDAVLADDPAVTRVVGRPFLSWSIADVRGLVGSPALAVQGQPVALRQGQGAHREGNGLHALLATAGVGQRLRFHAVFKSSLGGTESLAIAPIGDSNRIALSSRWPHPQFAGRFLPRSRSIDASGFRAAWDISSLAAGTQAQYLANDARRELDSLQLGLVEPVNAYSQADRATKYGILFVLLTFVAFFMFELLKRLAIHPVQYLLVGLALAIFFLLLLSLSEHVPFLVAYLVASAGCIGLLGVYLSAVLGSAARGWGFAGGLTLLYAALYGLLVSEDNALVLGSLMLFAILAGLMLVTRRVDWYRAGGDSTGAAQ